MTLRPDFQTAVESIVSIHSATVTLTDDQIKALPAAPVEVVPAPGADKVIVPIVVIAVIDNASPYSDIGSIDSALWFVYTPEFNDGGAGGFSLPNGTWNEGAAGIITNRVPVAAVSGLADATNKPVLLWHDANPITGGDPTNTIVITVLYSVVDI